jgi:hypothetical protein
MNFFAAIPGHLCYMSILKSGNAAMFGKPLTISPCAFRLESVAPVMSVHDRTSTIQSPAQSSASPRPPFAHVSRLDPVPSYHDHGVALASKPENPETKPDTIYGCILIASAKGIRRNCRARNPVTTDP